MTTLTQGLNNLEFMISDAGTRSYSQATLTISGAASLPSGTVLGKIDATGKFIAHDNALGDTLGGKASAVLCYASPATNGDHQVTVVDADAEVWGAKLNNGVALHATVKPDLLTVGIKVR